MALKRKWFLAIVVVGLLAGMVLATGLAFAAPPQQGGGSGDDPPTPQPSAWEQVLSWFGDTLGTEEDTPDAWEVIMRLFNSLLVTIFQKFTQFILKVVWFVEKIINIIAQFIIFGFNTGSGTRNIWQMIWTPVLEQLRQLYVGNGAMQSLIFGAGGLAYVAIMVAGISLVVPYATISLAKPDKVIFWAAIVSVIFVGGGLGFDIMGQIESVRMATAQSLMSSEMANLGDLVAVPMKATPTEATSLTFELPTAYERLYFPEPSYMTKKLGIKFGLFAIALPRVQVETDMSLEARKTQGSLGFVVGLLTIPGAIILFDVAICFASLTVAAIMLLIFFVAAIPLGFFEFGSPILMNIFKQYVYVFALTIMISVVVIVMLGITLASFPAVVNGPQHFLGFLPIALVMIMMMSRLNRMTIDVMGGSWNTLSKSVDAVGTMAYDRGTTSQDIEKAGKTMVGAAVAMGLTAATGGAALPVLAAGAGSMASATQGGRQAGRAVRLASDGRVGQTFGTAAMGGDAIGVAVLQSRFNRRDQAKYVAASQRETARRDPQWQAINAGPFLTTDLSELTKAEDAFFNRKDKRMAEVHLERAFGTPEMADKVAKVYETKGEGGAGRVRKVVETAQGVAMMMGGQGEAVFDSQGRMTEAYHRSLRSALGRGAFIGENNATFTGELAGATVRRPVPIWSDSNAAYKLAGATLNPSNAAVRVADIPAQLQLKDLAVKMGWGEGELTALYMALQRAITQSSDPSGPTTDVAEALGVELSQIPAFQNTSRSDLERAARMAVLVAGEGAQAQSPITLDAGRQGTGGQLPPVPMSQLAWNPDMYDQAVNMFYRGPGTLDAQGQMVYPPASGPTPERMAQSHEILVRAMGSSKAADKIMDAWQGGASEDEAKQLSALMEQTVNVNVNQPFKADGSPSSQLLVAVKEAAQSEAKASNAHISPAAEAMFESVSQDVMWAVSEDMSQNADVWAGRIVNGAEDSGEAAEQLSWMAQDQGWNEGDVTLLIQETINGTSPTVVATMPPFTETGLPNVQTAMSLTRDTIREQAVNAPPGRVDDIAAGAMDMEADLMGRGFSEIDFVDEAALTDAAMDDDDDDALDDGDDAELDNEGETR